MILILLVESLKLLFMHQTGHVSPILFLAGSLALKSETDEFESTLCNHYMILVSFPKYMGLNFPSAKLHCTRNLQTVQQILDVFIFAQQRLVSLFFLSQPSE